MGRFVDAGTAALVWSRIRHAEGELPPEILQTYRKAYILSVAQAIAHEVDLAKVVAALNDSGVRAILLKGWPVGRLSPEPGLRPFGDIDLWIHPDQRPQAESAIRQLSTVRACIDLDHDQIGRFEQGDFEDLYRRGRTVKISSTPVRILGKEDQIRILALHFLKHGGCRLLWLWDIALLLEWEPSVFDWHLCLGTHTRRARWVGCTIALAHEILGARLPKGAPADVTTGLPSWLKKTALKEWSKPPTAPSLLREFRSDPTSLKCWFWERWRNPIQATIDCNGSFNDLPRWPYQLWDGASRLGGFMSRRLHAMSETGMGWSRNGKANLAT